MVKMEVQEYIKRYLGPLNERRTRAYNKNGINTKKFKVVDTPYKGLYKILRRAPYEDISAFIFEEKIYRVRCIRQK